MTQLALLAIGSAICTTAALASAFMNRVVFETIYSDLQILLNSSICVTTALAFMAFGPLFIDNVTFAVTEFSCAAMAAAKEAAKSNQISASLLIGAYPRKPDTGPIEIPKEDTAAEARFAELHPPRDKSYWAVPVDHGYDAPYKAKIRSMVENGLLTPLSTWKAHLNDGIVSGEQDEEQGTHNREDADAEHDVERDGEEQGRGEVQHSHSLEPTKFPIV